MTMLTTFPGYAHLSPRQHLLRLPDEAWEDFPHASTPPAWLAGLSDEGRMRAARLPGAGEMLQARARGEALLPRGSR